MRTFQYFSVYQKDTLSQCEDVLYTSDTLLTKYQYPYTIWVDSLYTANSWFTTVRRRSCGKTTGLSRLRLCARCASSRSWSVTASCNKPCRTCAANWVPGFCRQTRESRSCSESLQHRARSPRAGPFFIIMMRERLVLFSRPPQRKTLGQ